MNTPAPAMELANTNAMFLTVICDDTPAWYTVVFLSALLIGFVVFTWVIISVLRHRDDIQKQNRGRKLLQFVSASIFVCAILNLFLACADQLWILATQAGQAVRAMATLNLAHHLRFFTFAFTFAAIIFLVSTTMPWRKKGSD